MAKSPVATADQWFKAALRVILKPLARTLIRQGVTAPAVYQIIKQAYVEVASEEFGLDGAPPTDSRVSVLTGVYRREVKALRAAAAGEEAAPAKKKKNSILSLVVGRWLASPETTDAAGAPLSLPRTAGASGPSFESLVASISTDVRPRTVLDELVRQELAILSTGEKGGEVVTLRDGALVGPDDLQQRLHFFAANLADHIAAAESNLGDEGPKFLERAVYYNRLKASSVDALEATARDMGGEMLLAINREANARQREDAATEAGVERFRLGVYFYRVDEMGAAATAEKGADAATAGAPEGSGDDNGQSTDKA